MSFNAGPVIYSLLIQLLPQYVLMAPHLIWAADFLCSALGPPHEICITCGYSPFKWTSRQIIFLAPSSHSYMSGPHLCLSEEAMWRPASAMTNHLYDSLSSSRVLSKGCGWVESDIKSCHLRITRERMPCLFALDIIWHVWNCSCSYSCFSWSDGAMLHQDAHQPPADF